jgi:hypothetical protein
MKIVAAVLSAVVLVACGGGGGGGSSTPTVAIDPNLTVPLQAAAANLTKTGFSKPFTVTGWDDQSAPAVPVPVVNFTGNGTFTLGAPTVATTVKGVAALRSTQVISGSIAANGKSTAISSTADIYVDATNYSRLATSVGGQVTYFSSMAYPVTVKTGSAGSLGDGTEGNSSRISTRTAYVVSSDGPSSLLVTVLETLQSSVDAFGGFLHKTQTVYRVDTSGGMSIISITAESTYLGSVYKSATYSFQ